MHLACSLTAISCGRRRSEISDLRRSSLVHAGTAFDAQAQEREAVKRLIPTSVVATCTDQGETTTSDPSTERPRQREVVGGAQDTTRSGQGGLAWRPKPRASRRKRLRRDAVRRLMLAFYWPLGR